MGARSVPVFNLIKHKTIPSTEYALRLRSLEWLREWHTQPEHNAKGIRDIEQPRGLRLKDEEVTALVAKLVGCTPMQLKDLPENKKEIVLHALYQEEGATISQISRLTGISRGIIRRYLL